jgi:hypothetical protein
MIPHVVVLLGVRFAVLLQEFIRPNCWAFESNRLDDSGWSDGNFCDSRSLGATARSACM